MDVLDEQLEQAASSCRMQEDQLTQKRAQIKALKAELEQLQQRKVDIQQQVTDLVQARAFFGPCLAGQKTESP